MSVDDPRDRLTSGFSQSRLRLELHRGLRPALLVVVSVAAAAIGIGYLLNQISPTMLNSSYQAKFAVDNASGVISQVDQVRFKGIPVGTIENVDLEHGQAVLTVRILSKWGRIYRDARAQLRPNTALQDMYLDVVSRGTPQAGTLGENQPLSPSQTETPVTISDVLNTFGPSQRLGLRTLLDQLGNGLQDRGASLRAIFVELAPFVVDVGRISSQLGERSALVRQLVHNAGALTGDLAARQAQLRTLLLDGGQTLRTLQLGSANLNATLSALPPTLATVQSSFSTLRGTLGDVNGAVRALYPVADRLPQSLSDLRRLALAANPAITALRRPVGQLVPFAQSLLPVSVALDRATSALASQIHTVNKVTRDLVLCKTGIQNFFQWNASISKFGDVRAPIPRGNVVLGLQSSSILADPGENAQASCTPGSPIDGRVATAADEH
ncbi:MAG: MlaD family protein [Solirubrobacteraceae bacterium]